MKEKFKKKIIKELKFVFVFNKKKQVDNHKQNIYIRLV